MNKHKIRVYLELVSTFMFCWLYIPHILCYAISNKKTIDEDLDRWKDKTYIKMPRIVLLLYKLHYDPFFRVIFYHRIGPVLKMLIGWYRKGERSFRIRPSKKIGGGLYAPHAFGTTLGAGPIGRNFTVIQGSTIGKKNDKFPVIGDNVTFGANVIVIGDVTIGDNVMVGAGSVVTKDVPPNTVVAGVPAKVIKTKDISVK